jgi:ribonuclease BN (tRNA processing enzyme)
VQAAEKNILCDTGPGALRQLLLAGTGIADIDMIVYTHFHIDHTADFCPFLFASKYGPQTARDRELTVVGPQGLAAWYDSLRAAHGSWIVPERFTLRWVESAQASHCLGRLTVTTAPVEHSGPSIAVRFDEPDGTSAAYSGDTGYCDGIINICSNVSKAILECSFPEGQAVEGHLTPRLAGRIARQAGCKSLVLTHMYPDTDKHDLIGEVCCEYDGPVEIARDLMSFTV